MDKNHQFQEDFISFDRSGAYNKDDEMIKLLNEGINEDNKKFKILNDIPQQMVTPWLKKSTLKIKNPLAKFHNEILDFYDYIWPSDEEHHVKEMLFKNLKKIIKQELPECKVIPFGSFVSRMYLPNSDIDFAVIQENKNKQQLLYRVAKCLQANTDIYENIQIIKSAKVPLIKFVHKQTKIPCDISFNQEDGIRQIEELKKALEIYPEIKYIIMIMKCMLKQRDLNETYTGGVGSFLLFCMTLTFLRELRKQYIQAGKLKELQNLMLSEIILKYFEFYGIKFDCSNQKILMQDGGMIVQKKEFDNNFNLISPQDSTHDIGGPAFRIKEVFSFMKNRYNFMTNYNYAEGESILQYLINPSKDIFTFIKSETL